jgi:hypothetical protein
MITAIGVLTVRKNTEPSRRLFAAIPLVFGVQQISEGFVWVALQSPGHELMLQIASYTFLFAAVFLWPALVPLSVLLMEPSARRRRALVVFLAIGVATSLYYGSGLLFHDVNPEISSHHIRYTNTFPRQFADMAFAAYLLATLIPLFISGVRRMWIFGILVTVSCLVTGIFYREYLTSVWCFFAAIISVVILLIVSSPATRQPSGSRVQGEII